MNIYVMFFHHEKIVEFQWDSGNDTKNWIKHRVSCREAEEIFFNAPLKIIEDQKHSKKEKRFHAFGKTKKGKFLSITFTIRGSKIRIISARSMHKKERKYYEQ